MAGIYDLPPMGNDFTSLANAARPSYNVPMSGSAAGWMMGGDLARQDQFLAQAAQEAQQNAQMRAVAAEEHAMGAPGRKANIQLGNAKAEAGLADLPQVLDAERSKREAGMAEDRGKVFKAEQKQLQDLADEWHSAKDDETRNEIRSRLPKIKGKDLSQMPPELVDKLMKNIREANVNSTEQQQKKDLEKIKGDNRVTVEQEKTRRAREVAQYSAQARIKAAEIAKQGKEVAKNIYELLMREKTDGKITPYREAILDAIIENTFAKAYAIEANKPDQIDIGGALTGGTPTVRQRTTPKPAKMPETPKTDTPAPAATTQGKPKMSEQDALQEVLKKKGTPEFEKYKKFFKDAYGKEPNV